MKRNVLQNVIEFLFKYIWLLCSILIALELVSTVYTGTILMKKSTQGIIESVCGEVSGRVDGVLRLLTGISKDARFSDTSIPLFDRAVLARSYRDSYNLYMIAFTDENVNVVSTNEMTRPVESTSLAHRDYMQRLYTTGEYQITDAFPAGADGVTMNYTIAVPIFEAQTVAGCVFGSIYFEDIQKILMRDLQDDSYQFYLLGQNNTIMHGGSTEEFGKSFLEVTEKEKLLGTSRESVDLAFREGKSGDFWEWGTDGLCYVAYRPVASTDWTLVYRVQFLTVILTLFPVLFLKTLFYVLTCGLISLFGQRYLRRHLTAVNHLLDRVTVMQKELFQSEQPDYDNLLELTQKGLSDQLTGLSTRAVLFNKMIPFLTADHAYGALMFIDLDDLKRINDNFGHESGDHALLHFAKTLKQYEETYHAIAARYGGDEFIVVFPSVDEKQAEDIAQALCSALTATLKVKTFNFTIHGTIGVSLYPEHGCTPEDLICRADLALYSAKQQGKNRFAFFNETHFSN